MTIEEQANESWGKFVDFHLADLKPFWAGAFTLDDPRQVYVTGWMQGYASRLEIGYDSAVDDDTLWVEGEDRTSNFFPITEENCRLFAAGFTGGYKHW